MQIMGHKTPQEGKGTVEIEKRTSKIPSGFYLAAGLTCHGRLRDAQMLGRKHSALFVGQWAAPILIMGLYNKMVKTQGHD